MSHTNPSACYVLSFKKLNKVVFKILIIGKSNNKKMDRKKRTVVWEPHAWLLS